MDKERETLEIFLDCADRLKSGLNCRNWNELEVSIKSMEELTGDIGQLEDTRMRLVSEVGGKKAIEQTLNNYDFNIRQRYNRAKSELKTRLLSVKARCRIIEQYAETRNRIGQEMMENLIPEFRGKIYNGRGQTAVREKNALLLSRYY